MRNLSPEQINQLFQFCEKHYIKYYDVQVELVDHLATAIEIALEQNKELTFEEALRQEYKTFGTAGFGKFMSVKEQAIIKMLTKERRKHFLLYFTPPKLFMVLIGTIFLIFPYWKDDMVMAKAITTCFCIMIPTAIIIYIYEYLKYKKQEKKKLLLLHQGMNYYQSIVFNINIAIVGQLLIRIANHEDLQFSMNAYLWLILCAYFSGIYILSSRRQFQSLLQLSKTNYPTAFI